MRTLEDISRDYVNTCTKIGEAYLNLKDLESASEKRQYDIDKLASTVAGLRKEHQKLSQLSAAPNEQSPSTVPVDAPTVTTETITETQATQ